MAHALQGFFGERSVTKVAGLFREKSEAESTLQQMVRSGGLRPDQVRLLGPQDARLARQEVFGQSLEPESRGIVRTFLRTHLVGAMAGALLGLAIYAWFRNAAHPAIQAAPVMAPLAMVGFATALGMMFGGLLTIRPDHVRLITRVRSALRDNQWAVVAHPTSPEQMAQVREVLESGKAAEVVSTL